jgi:Ca2+-binding EF-hand superfamily protein
MGCGASSQPADQVSSENAAPAAAPAPAAQAAQKAEAEFFLNNIQLGMDEEEKVEKIQTGNIKYLSENPADMAVVDKIFAACDADGNGVIDKEEMVGRYGKQAGHMLKEFDLDSGKTISKAEFVAVLDDKYQKDAKRTAKWVKFLSREPAAKGQKKVEPEDDNWLFRITLNLPDPEDEQESAEAVMENLCDAMQSEEGQGELKALFDKLDKNSDGKVGSKEWGRSVFQNKDLLAKYFGGSNMKEIASAFNRLDTNNSDLLTWDEFAAATKAEPKQEKKADVARSWALVRNVVSVMQTKDGSKEMQALFDKLDKDGDGKLSSREWGRSLFRNKDALNKYFGRANLRELGQMFSKIDANGNDSLSWDEFSGGAKAMGESTKLAAKGIRSVFKSLDATGDGLVDKEELTAALKLETDKGELKTLMKKAGLNYHFYVLQQIDANGDGKISWAEFKAALQDDKATPGKRRPRSNSI